MSNDQVMEAIELREAELDADEQNMRLKGRITELENQLEQARVELGYLKENKDACT